jgi:uncharacterized OsmC-like protein
VRGAIDDDQLHTLKRVAAHCPVSKSLAAGVVIKDTLTRG